VLPGVSGTPKGHNFSIEISLENIIEIKNLHPGVPGWLNYLHFENRNQMELSLSRGSLFN